MQINIIFSCVSVCNQFSRGVFAMLGAVSPDSFDTLHSYSNTFQMPFVTPWFPEKVRYLLSVDIFLFFFAVYLDVFSTPLILNHPRVARNADNRIKTELKSWHRNLSVCLIQFQVLTPSSGFLDFAISMRPDYHQAIIDTIRFYGWDKITYLYDSHDGE